MGIVFYHVGYLYDIIFIPVLSILVVLVHYLLLNAVLFADLCECSSEVQSRKARLRP
jgi:hypothetical protein